MASNSQIQKPYAVATLPNPLSRPDYPGKCTARVVSGLRPEYRKPQRRSELAIGIDGDAVNLYDVPSSRLITSYPVPPQYFFTCPPCSIRWKAGANETVRYTYACAEQTEYSKRRIMLFKNVVGKGGVTALSSSYGTLLLSSPIIHLTTTPTTAIRSVPAAENGPNIDLIAVASDGTILCLNRETFAEKWRVSSSTYLDSMPASAGLTYTVEFVQSALATEVMDGFFNGKPDQLSIFPQEVSRNGFDPDVLVLIVSSLPASTASPNQRELLVLALPGDAQTQKNGHPQGRVLQVSTAVLPSPSDAPADPANYRLHVESGSLQELRGDALYTYRIHEGIPRLSYTVPVPGVSSFLRLSDSSVLAASNTSLSVYNPAYCSIQASTALELSAETPNSIPSDENTKTYQLINYFPRLQLALGIRGTTLFAAQLEAPKTRKRKRRAEGLLIDSIGRGLPQARGGQHWSAPDSTSTSFASYLPGSLSESYWTAWVAETTKADELLDNQDVAGFEELVADKIGAQLASKKPNVAYSPDNMMDVDTTEQELQLQLATKTKSEVDRRWILYVITRAFALEFNHQGGAAEVRLSCQLPRSNVADYLISAGYLSVSNIKSAFNEETREMYDHDAVLAEKIPELVASLDPTLELLVEYLSATRVDAIGLLTSIRLIMRSLDLVQDPDKLAQKQITMGETEKSGGGDEEETFGMKLDKLEEDLEVMEYHLLDDSSTRARGLTVAFDLLGSCSPVATVQAIRRLLRPEETLSLMHVLRVELVKGGWTARYLDTSQLEGDDEQEPPPDDSIRLIADLLCRCIDSVGPGGWMINDALLARTGDHLDSADFLAGLKLEVSAALEGIEEALYLRGLLTEMVKYGNSIHKSLGDATPHKKPHKGTPFKNTPHKGTAHGRGARKPQTVVAPTGESGMLPFGLGSRQRNMSTKVISGGEIVTRSKREIGHLVSQRVGAYSLERIVV